MHWVIEYGIALLFTVAIILLVAAACGMGV